MRLYDGSIPHNVNVIARHRCLILAAAVMLFLSACGHFSTKTAGKTSGNKGTYSGGYYQDDGPPRKHDLKKALATPDAIPVDLPLSRTGNAPYKVFGKRYKPLAKNVRYKKVGNASWYGKKYHGRRTSSGEVYDMYAMTAAHPVLPIPSFVKVTNLQNQRNVIVKVNDRGPFLRNRIIDLSYVAALKLDVVSQGTAKVEVELLSASTPKTKSKERVSVPLSANKLKTKSATHNAQKERALIQVAAYSNYQNAVNTRHRLLNEGLIEPNIIEDTRNQKKLYRIQVGPVQRHLLEPALRTLNNLGFNPIVLN